jgi:hypothetical protein
MAKVTLASYLRERPTDRGAQDVGPFLTISRQFGCYGFSLGLLILEILNDQPGMAVWKIYNREILERLAAETNIEEELISTQRLETPSFISDFFRGLSSKRVPSGAEVRRQVTTIIRGLVLRGHAVIVGQGGAAVTSDLPNGLSIRMEAPDEWRVQQVMRREGLSSQAAADRIRTIERQRSHLRKLYEQQFPHRPPFNITYDCSRFSMAEIARHVTEMMQLRKMV